MVPAAPGASTDFVARLSAEHISRVQGVTAVVENRPGANGVIGVEAVSRAAPDGNTLLVTANTYLLDDLLRKPPYDPVAAFDPVCFLVQTPAVLVVNAESPYHTLRDLLDAAKAKPGELSVAAVGPGSTLQLGLLALSRAAGVSMIYVPYNGSAPAVTAALGGHVTAAISGYAVVVEQIKGGKLRALATATLKRIEPQPDLPTMDELGFKGIEIDNWFARGGAGQDAEGQARRAFVVVHGGDGGAGVQGEARRAISLYGEIVRRGFRRHDPQDPRHL